MREPPLEHSPTANTSGRTSRGFAAWQPTATRARPARRPGGAARPWPSARRCATATAGSAIARPFAAVACDDGPTPEGGCGRVHQCRPCASLRAIRGRFVAACALSAAGGTDAHAQRRLAR